MTENTNTRSTTPREDPVARAARLLGETIEKSKLKAQELLGKAEEELAVSQRNADKALRVRDERAARVDRLKNLANGNSAHVYAAALGQEEIAESFDIEDDAPMALESEDTEG